MCAVNMILSQIQHLLYFILCKQCLILSGLKFIGNHAFICLKGVITDKLPISLLFFKVTFGLWTLRSGTAWALFENLELLLLKQVINDLFLIFRNQMAKDL